MSRLVVGKLQNIPRCPEGHAQVQGWAHAQEGPEEGLSFTVTDLVALRKPEAKAEAGLSVACSH